MIVCGFNPDQLASLYLRVAHLGNMHGREPTCMEENLHLRKKAVAACLVPVLNVALS